MGRCGIFVFENEHAGLRLTDLIKGIQIEPVSVLSLHYPLTVDQRYLPVIR